MRFLENIPTRFYKGLLFAFLSLCITACGSYQAVTYDDDGIYADSRSKPVPQARPQQQVTNAPAQASVGDNYFSKKLEELRAVEQEEAEVFTDIENYSSGNYSDTNENNAIVSNPGWEDSYDNSNTTINVIGGNAWGWGGFYNNYYPFWNRGFRNFYGFNGGFGPYWNGGFYNGFNNPYIGFNFGFGNGFYGQPFYGNNFYGGFYNRPYRHRYYRSPRYVYNSRRVYTRNSNGRAYSSRNGYATNRRTYSNNIRGAKTINNSRRTYSQNGNTNRRTYSNRNNTNSNNRSYSSRNRTYTPRSNSSSSIGRKTNSSSKSRNYSSGRSNSGSSRTYSGSRGSSSSRSYSRGSSSGSRSYGRSSSGSSGRSYRRR